MLRLKKANPEDAYAEWKFVMETPSDENGFTNSWSGCSYEQFVSEAIPWMQKYERGEDLPEGHVPEVFYFLWHDDKVVGEFRVRCQLTDALRHGAGHIGYAIARDERGKGYGSEGLRLTLQEAAHLVKEEEFYLRVRRNNPASLRIMQKNGGRIVGEDAECFFVRIMNPAAVVIAEEEISKENEAVLIELSNDWTEENSCYGYRPNTHEDLSGRLLFTARYQGKMIGYLFGIFETASRTDSIRREGERFFEIEELYILPQYRSLGIGRRLYQACAKRVQREADLIMLSTATKDWKKILHFYIEEMGMDFWSARLFQRLK